ncbi:hypothetical protein LCGC14_0222580 [marine sediment metagenome]
MNTFKTLTAAIAFASIGATAPAVLAQAGSTAPPPGAPAQQQQQPGTTGGQMGSGMGAATQAQLSDQDLEKFASAESKVSEIREEFSARLSEANDQEEAQNLQMEAQEKMVEAVEEEGLPIPKYNEIATRMQTDAELQQRIESMN